MNRMQASRTVFFHTFQTVANERRQVLGSSRGKNPPESSLCSENDLLSVKPHMLPVCTACFRRRGTLEISTDSDDN